MELIVIAAIVIALIFFVVVPIVISNNIIRLSRLCDEAWSGMDVVLKRRHDLIPNLVECVKGYMAHEQATLAKVIELRNGAASAQGATGAIAAEAALVPALSGLFMKAEAYPDLKSSANFLQLQEELANTEDRIAAARRFYNNNVREFNVAIESFPGSMLKGSRTPKEFFEVDEVEVKSPVKVTFTGD